MEVDSHTECENATENKNQRTTVFSSSHIQYTPLTNICRSALRATDAAEVTMRVLIAHRADVHSGTGHIPLCEAIVCGSVRAALLFLEAGASPGAKTEDGEHLLMTTAREAGYAVFLHLLLAHGADRPVQHDGDHGGRKKRVLPHGANPARSWRERESR